MGGCGSAGNDPWHEGRPMSMGHLRNKIDGSISQPWHSYITAYTKADISAQQLDGATNFEEFPPFNYANNPKPVYNTEDLYEGPDDPNSATPYKLVKNPDYFYRRLFWSHLLSGSGATYGAYPTWRMMQEYEGGTYLVYPDPTSTPASTPTPIVVTLEGLDSITFTNAILQQAQVDLASFAPADELIAQVTPTSAWTEYERAQVVSNTQEILAYIPHTSLPAYPVFSVRQRAMEDTTTDKSVTVNMTKYRDPTYRVTWFEPATGQVVSTDTITGNVNGLLNDPRSLPLPAHSGDVVLHISSRCESPNACQPMDASPPISTTVNGFEAGADMNTQLITDTSRSALAYPGTISWRCDRLPATETKMPGCWVRYDFDSGHTVASADFYFRRNSQSSYLGVFFLTTPDPDPQTPIPDGEDGRSLDVWFNDAGDMYTTGDPEIPWTTDLGVASELNRWYHLSARVERTGQNAYLLAVDVDGKRIRTRTMSFSDGERFFRRTVVHTAWWVPSTDLPPDTDPSVWWDQLSIDPPTVESMEGLYRTVFQEGLGGYAGNRVAWFDGSTNGYNQTALINVGANNVYKSLLRFNTSNLPSNAIVDEATLELYYTGRSNGNSLTLGAHRVLAEWTDSEVNRIQRKAGSNWAVAGMGSGNDYTAAPEASFPIASAGDHWVQLDVTAAAQDWISDPSTNYGLLLMQEAASGWVSYQFCGELGWTPAQPLKRLNWWFVTTCRSRDRPMRPSSRAWRGILAPTPRASPMDPATTTARSSRSAPTTG